ncbi:MAG TPA: response regulator [Cellvibrionaceae bacterium]
MSDLTDTTILVIEDEPKLGQLIIDYLNADGFTTIWLQDGLNAIEIIKRHAPSLILLDVMLPGINGFSLCKEIRTFSQIPVVLLTARTLEEDRINGFETGADDYICKPFSFREVVFRVKVILKRIHPKQAIAKKAVPQIDFDFSAYTAKVNGLSLDLTPVEFGIFATLAQFPGRVFSRNELLDRVYAGHHVINDRTIDSHIRNLRRKLKIIVPDEDVVQSIYGLGYKVEARLCDKINPH